MTQTSFLRDSEIDEAMYHFGNLLRLDTTNPPGNEAAAARYINGVLGAEGIPCEVVEPEPGRASLVARLSAGRPQEGLLVSAHTDVVPAAEDGWTHPPFEGRIADGFVWGRGALDMKHMAVYGMMAMVLARRRGLKLGRDLAFAAVADEEQGCGLGSLHIARHRPELLAARYCLTEIGGFTLDVGGHRLLPVQVAQKGFAWVRVSAHGPAGHGSLPDPDSAPWRLARGIKRLESGLLEHRLCPQAVAFLDAVASCLPPAQAAVIHGLKMGGVTPLLLKAIPNREQARFFAAILHDTVALTVLRSGDKENVVPGLAEAVLDLRVLPGRRVSEAVGRLRAALGEGMEIRVLRSGEPVESAYPSPLWEAIKATVRRTMPEARVVPSLTTGFTDALAYSTLGITTYGFAPVSLPPEIRFSSLIHGLDERIPVDGFRWGLETFVRLVFEFCGEEGAS